MQLVARRRAEAEWVAHLLNTQYKERITAADLLGEAPSEEEKLAAAEKKLEKLQRQMKGKHG